MWSGLQHAPLANLKLLALGRARPFRKPLRLPGRRSPSRKDSNHNRLVSNNMRKHCENLTRRCAFFGGVREFIPHGGSRAPHHLEVYPVRGRCTLSWGGVLYPGEVYPVRGRRTLFVGVKGCIPHGGRQTPHHLEAYPVRGGVLSPGEAYPLRRCQGMNSSRWSSDTTSPGGVPCQGRCTLSGGGVLCPGEAYPLRRCQVSENRILR